jgi:hypothetical protein
MFETVKAFYNAHPIWFWIISISTIVLAVAIVFSIIRFRERKWLAIEKIEDMHKLHWREFEKFITFVLRKKGYRTEL